MPAQETRVHLIVVDPDRVFRDSFAVAIERGYGHRVVGHASTAREALRLVQEAAPTVVVSELFLPDSDGLSLALELKRRHVVLPMLALSQISQAHILQECLQSGFNGYVLKREPLEVVVSALEVVAAGGRYTSRQVVPTSEASPLASLSRREREILFLIIQGLASRDVAQRLFISEKTVEAHRFRINRKLGVRSGLDLARFAAENGLLGIPIKH